MKSRGQTGFYVQDVFHRNWCLIFATTNSLFFSFGICKVSRCEASEVVVQAARCQWTTTSAKKEGAKILIGYFASLFRFVCVSIPFRGS